MKYNITLTVTFLFACSYLPVIQVQSSEAQGNLEAKPAVLGKSVTLDDTATLQKKMIASSARYNAVTAAPVKQLTDAIEIKDRALQYDSLRDFIYIRQAQFYTLIGKLDSPVGSETFSAAYLLGLLHFPEALPHLIQHIAAQNSQTERFDRDTPLLWGDFPVAQAIGKFGHEATPFLLTNLTAVDSSKNRDVSLDTLVGIEGLDGARLLVSSALAKETDVTKKARLQLAVTSLQNRAQ